MLGAQLIRPARRSRKLTQRDLARASGFTQPALGDIERGAHDTTVASASRLLAAAGYKLFGLPTTRSAAVAWADLIYMELRSSRRREEVAFRALIGLSDDLAGADPALRVALCVAPPASCGDQRFDAAIAGIVEHHLVLDGLPMPAWLFEPARSLPEPWAVSPYTEAAEVPDALLRHGVLLAASELQST